MTVVEDKERERERENERERTVCRRTHTLTKGSEKRPRSSERQRQTQAGAALTARVGKPCSDERPTERAATLSPDCPPSRPPVVAGPPLVSSSGGASRPAAAIPIDDPYCSCVGRTAKVSAGLYSAPAAASCAAHSRACLKASSPRHLIGEGRLGGGRAARRGRERRRRRYGEGGRRLASAGRIRGERGKRRWIRERARARASVYRPRWFAGKNAVGWRYNVARPLPDDRLELAFPLGSQLLRQPAELRLLVQHPRRRGCARCRRHHCLPAHRRRRAGSGTADCRKPSRRLPERSGQASAPQTGRSARGGRAAGTCFPPGVGFAVPVAGGRPKLVSAASSLIASKLKNERKNASSWSAKSHEVYWL